MRGEGIDIRGSLILGELWKCGCDSCVRGDGCGFILGEGSCILGVG